MLAGAVTLPAPFIYVSTAISTIIASSAISGTDVPGQLSPVGQSRLPAQGHRSVGQWPVCVPRSIVSIFSSLPKPP